MTPLTHYTPLNHIYSFPLFCSEGSAQLSVGREEVSDGVNIGVNIGVNSIIEGPSNPQDEDDGLRVVRANAAA